MSEQKPYIGDRQAMQLVTSIHQGAEVTPEDLAILQRHDQVAEVRSALTLLGGICVKNEDGTRNEQDYDLFRQMLLPQPSEEAVSEIRERLSAVGQSTVQATALSMLIMGRSDPSQSGQLDPYYDSKHIWPMGVM